MAQDFERLITFGDSLSDGGRFEAFTPAGAGRFTTNPDPIWIQVLASQLGLETEPAIAGGLNFAEGGARVFEFQPAGLAFSIPIRTQTEMFFAAGNTFDPDDLVTIQGGGNDFLALGDGEATLADVTAAAIDLADLADELVDAGAENLLIVNLPTIGIVTDPLEAQLAANGTNALFLNLESLLPREIRATKHLFCTSFTCKRV